MNKFLIKRTLTAVLLSAYLLTTPVYTKERFFGDSGRVGKIFVSQPFLRTELFFGTGKPDGSVVSEEEWQRFLAEEVTPRFPEGFTVVAGDGQFRDEQSGKIIREKSFILIVLYPLPTRKTSRRKIEQIRRAYVKAFEQQSVLRVDYPQILQVSF
ncbi:MAG TPA: DUF3574 domain-containing protein [Pyrinomonadaceae bacterium]|jgi:hypothetical protein